MATIPLTKGLVAVVDDEDYERLSRHKWYAQGNTQRWVCAARRKRRRCILMHRFLVGLEPGSTQLCDHINGNPLDNRKVNLRVVNCLQNSQNRQRSANRKRGGYTGVCWHKATQRWAAKIRVPNPSGGPGKKKWLGLYDDAADAARAYDAAAVELFGQFAAPNFPQKGTTDEQP